jgi:Ca-activated chloride channel family protein
MKSILLIALFCISASVISQDDVYFSPGKKPRPLKDRKMYTPIAERQPEAGKSLYFSAGPVNQYVLNDNAGNDIYFYIFLQGAEHITAGNTERVPMNISFVIDRSGSMSGKKLEDVKKAVDYATGLLHAEDYISVVQYDHEVQTVIEPCYAGETERIRSKIKAIMSGGSTNLCGGMEKGLTHVKNNSERIQGNRVIHRVILLSDGLANVGTTDPSAIAEIARKYNLEYGITLSTIGVGADYNEDLMTKISVEGGGNYYFINNTGDLQTIFNSEFSDLKTLVAKDVIIELTFPDKKVTFDKVYQYPFTRKGNTVRIRLTDFFAEQQKAILIKFHTTDRSLTELDFTAQLQYTNTIGEEKSITETQKAAVTGTGNKDMIPEGVNANAHMGYTLMMSSDFLAKAQLEADRRNFETARDYVKQGMLLIDEHFCYVVPNPYLEEIYKDLKKYKGEISDLETTKDPIQFKLIQKGSKNRNYSNSYKSCRLL